MDQPKEQREQSNVLEKKVREYYDDNTKMFLKLGADGQTRSLHQPLFLEPSYSLAQAMHAQHDLILSRLQTLETPAHVLDLGCGVGSSMIYLAQHTRNVQFTGLTLSPQQAKLGTAAIRDAGLQDRVHIMVASFQDIPDSIPPAHLAYAIESVIHATSIDDLLQHTCNHLFEGAEFIVFDDFVRRSPVTRQERRVLEEFRSGWQAYGLKTIEEINKAGSRAGLELLDYTDYTDAQRLGRLRDQWVRLIVPFARLLQPLSSYCTFLVGGNARQSAFRHKLLAYGLVILRRKPTRSS